MVNKAFWTLMVSIALLFFAPPLYDAVCTEDALNTVIVGAICGKGSQLVQWIREGLSQL